MAKNTTRRPPKKAVTKALPPGRFVPPREDPPGLVVANAGDTTVNVAEWSGGRKTLTAGKHTVIRPCLLGMPGRVAEAAGPIALAARSVAFVSLESESDAAKVTLDASSLRGQGALYGAPEIILLQDAKGSRAAGDRAVLELAPGRSATVLVVGRGPVLNLGGAIQSLFRPRDPAAQEK